jgi:hypothetical protein
MFWRASVETTWLTKSIHCSVEKCFIELPLD